MMKCKGQKMATEKRFISLDEALDATHREVFWTESEQAAVRSFLVKQPKVDSVEVVRCKDCKYRHDSCFAGVGNTYCDKKRAYFPLDGFCCYGERRANARCDDSV